MRIVRINNARGKNDAARSFDTHRHLRDRKLETWLRKVDERQRQRGEIREERD